MSQQSVRVRAPATSANLGPGFDALGVAIDWTAEIAFERRDGGEPTADFPSADPATAAIERMAADAARTALRLAGAGDVDVRATYSGDLPVGRGLGMSAAARAAGLVAGNHLAGGRLGEDVLREAAVELEGHGDNIIPALFGGLHVVVHAAAGRTEHLRIAPAEDLRLALLIPEFSMPTEESRQLLPAQISRADTVHNIGRAALVVGAIVERRYELLGTATEDILHQPARSKLFPAMYPIIEGARGAGAYGAYLSGGGSTVAAFVSPERGEAVAAAMLEVARAHELEAAARVVRLSGAGTEVVG